MEVRENKLHYVWKNLIDFNEQEVDRQRTWTDLQICYILAAINLHEAGHLYQVTDEHS